MSNIEFVGFFWSNDQNAFREYSKESRSEKEKEKTVCVSYEQCYWETCASMKLVP